MNNMARLQGSSPWRIAIAAIDAGFIMLSLLLALWLRFDDKSLHWVASNYLSLKPLGLLAFTFGCALLLFCLRMYRYAWLHAGLEAVRSLLLASTIWTVGLFFCQDHILSKPLPRSVLLIFWVMSTLLIGTLRILIRIVIRRVQERAAARIDGNGAHAASRHTRALVVGDAEYAAGIIKAMTHTHGLQHYDLIGILDSRSDRRGMLYGGVKVLGSPSLLNGFLKHRSLDEVIFASSDNSDGSDIRPLVLACRCAKVLAKIVPNLTESITKPKTIRIEDIRVEDLLRRPMQTIDINAFTEYISGKRVLITGAGGSIGSEICRQVMTTNPSALVLLGHGENSIFRIQQELSRSCSTGSTKVSPVIASVTNPERVGRIFQKFKPEVVFHAAAHKHLPLMENNVCEAVHNNLVGTYVIIQACLEHNVKSMVQISTDKAADPSSVMGATKYLCECLLKGVAIEHSETRFICVRFGNVLGSRGSVIPVFAAQIRNGGPVTVTDPEVTRYFMTIPEAVRLVIQAGAVGRSGQVYLLDMGKPVKILDLAEDMIRLNGLEPHVDIPIVFTGIRPGEKLHERLAAEDELIENTKYDGMNKVTSQPIYTWADMTRIVVRMQDMAADMNGGGILSAFERYIPGYAAKTRDLPERLAS